MVAPSRRDIFEGSKVRTSKVYIVSKTLKALRFDDSIPENHIGPLDVVTALPRSLPFDLEVDFMFNQGSLPPLIRT